MTSSSVLVLSVGLQAGAITMSSKKDKRVL